MSYDYIMSLLFSMTKVIRTCVDIFTHTSSHNNHKLFVSILHLYQL